MKTLIYIHSSIGSTPLTGRGRNFCDLLLATEIECDSLEDAKQVLKSIFDETPHAHYATYDVVGHSNQNLRRKEFIGSIK